MIDLQIMESEVKGIISKMTMNKPTKPHRLDVWGNGMLNQCNSRLRNRRKRCASKKRRVALKANDD